MTQVDDKKHEVLLKLLDKIDGAIDKADPHSAVQTAYLEQLAGIYAVVSSETPKNVTVVRK